MSFSPVVIAEVSAVRHGIPRCGVHCEQGTLIGTLATHVISEDPLQLQWFPASPEYPPDPDANCLWRIENGELVAEERPSDSTYGIMALTWWEDALWALGVEMEGQDNRIALWRRETGQSWEPLWHYKPISLAPLNSWRFYPTSWGLFYAEFNIGTWLYRGSAQQVSAAEVWVGEFGGLLYARRLSGLVNVVPPWTGPSNILWCSTQPAGYGDTGPPFSWRGRPVMLLGRHEGGQPFLSLWQIDGPAAMQLWETGLPAMITEPGYLRTHAQPYVGGLLAACQGIRVLGPAYWEDSLRHVLWSDGGLVTYTSSWYLIHSWQAVAGWEAVAANFASDNPPAWLPGYHAPSDPYTVDWTYNIIRQPWCTSVGALRFQWHTDRRWDDKASVGAFRFGWSDGSGGHKASVGGFRFGWSDGTGIGTATVGAFRFGWEATGNKDGAKALVNRFRFEWANACTPPDEGEHWFFVVHDGSQCDGVLVALSGDSANDCRCIVRAGDDTISPTDWTTYENCPVGCKHYLQRPGAIVRLAVIAPESVIEPPDVQITLLEE